MAVVVNTAAAWLGAQSLASIHQASLLAIRSSNWHCGFHLPPWQRATSHRFSPPLAQASHTHFTHTPASTPSESQSPPTPSINRHWPPGPHLLSTPGTILAIDYSTIPACLGLIGLCSSRPLPAPSIGDQPLVLGFTTFTRATRAGGPLRSSTPDRGCSIIKRVFAPSAYIPCCTSVLSVPPGVVVVLQGKKPGMVAELLTDHRTRDRLPKQAPTAGIPAFTCAPSASNTPTDLAAWVFRRPQ